MPELPDVENFRRVCAGTIMRKKIKSIESFGKKAVKEPRKEFDKALSGTSFSKAERHGKYLFLGDASRLRLVLHFGMTGFLKAWKGDEEVPPHTKLLVRFSGTWKLAWVCVRKLGMADLVSDAGEFIAHKNLGPDAARVARSDFINRIQDNRGSVKSALMKQSCIAGLGNIYSDEILYHSRIHPKSKCKKLSKEDLKNIFQNMEDIIATAIEAGANPDDMPRKYLLKRRNEDTACGICSGAISKIKISSRSCYYCPEHQNRRAAK